MSWDEHGRPSCEHGPAHRAGGVRWRCGFRHLEANRRYDKTEKGREVRRRINAAPATQSAKALYELSRIRVS